MPLEHYTILEEIGSGSFSTVFRIKDIETGNLFALKKVKINSLSAREKENALNEIRILASIHSPFVVQYKEAFYVEEDESLCIIMEYLDNFDLERKVKEYKLKGVLIPERFVWKVVSALCFALDELHKHKIIHRDLKTANVFLNQDFEAKIGDLNVAKVNKNGLVYTQTGTPYYAAPEVWRGRPYDSKNDIWSLGCVIYELCALEPPFRGTSMDDVFSKISKGSNLIS